jgi:hypothetical protein
VFYDNLCGGSRLARLDVHTRRRLQRAPSARLSTVMGVALAEGVAFFVTRVRLSELIGRAHQSRLVVESSASCEDPTDQRDSNGAANLYTATRQERRPFGRPLISAQQPLASGLAPVTR